MSTPAFDELASQAAAGLKSDAELYRDVTLELHAHLEDRAEKYTRAGHSEDESITLAKKAFGSPLEVAAELLQANTRRMKLRARLRLAVRALLIPAAVLLALYLACDIVQPARLLFVLCRDHSSPNTAPPPGIAWQHLLPDARRTEALRFLVEGDTTRKSRAAQQRAIWERHPENKAYFANYALWLAREEQSSLRTLPHFEKEMRLGEQVDPENALYNNLLADFLMQLGARVKRTPPNAEYAFALQIIDRAMLERAVAEVRRGAAKRYCNNYARELYRERVALLPIPNRFTEAYAPAGISGYSTFELTFGQVNPAKVLPCYASLLVTEGHTAEARAILAAWQRLLIHRVQTSNDIIETLILLVNMKQSGKDVAKVYDRLGDAGAATRMRRMTQHVEQWMQTRAAHLPSLGSALPRMGYLTSITYPRVQGTTLVDQVGIAKSRNLEYVLLEEGAVVLLIGLLALCMLFFALQARRCSAGVREAQSAPLLLLPTFPELLAIVGLAILLPLLLYYGYLQLPALSGRLYGLSQMEHLARIAVEITLVIVMLALLPGLLAKRIIRRRCAALEVELPPAGAWKPRLWQFACCRWKTRGYGLYYGSVARSLVPIYALAIMLIGGIAYPYLLRQERLLLRQGAVHLMMPGCCNPASVEYRVVDDIKQGMGEAWRESAGLR